jgi:STE24 endopeptidase
LSSRRGTDSTNRYLFVFLLLFTAPLFFPLQTLALYTQDKLMSLALSFVIGSPILACMIWVIRLGGPYFYFYVWIFFFVVSVVMMLLYPTLIAPLFNKYTKLEDGPVYQAIEELAKKVSFPLTQIYMVDGSRRSAHSNAYFYGFFKVPVLSLHVSDSHCC